MNEEINNDIPDLVAAEILAAQQAGIPEIDRPAYVADRLRLRLAGSVEYVRKRALNPAKRAEDIRRRFNGHNQAELAREYKLTLRRVQQIIAAGG